MPVLVISSAKVSVETRKKLVVSVKIKHIKRVRRKGGRVDYYHQITGEKLGADDIHVAAKMAARINLRLDEKREREIGGFGSIHDLITNYKGSTSYTSLAGATRKGYDFYLDQLDREYGTDMAKDMDREFALQVKENLSDTPTVADRMGAMLCKLCAWAIDRPSRYQLYVNPALKLGKMARTNGHQPWPKELLMTFERDNGDIWRAIEFILNTGQRVGDAVKARWDDFDGKRLCVKQSKTGAVLSLPFVSGYPAKLDEYPKRGDYILMPLSRRKMKDGVNKELVARPWSRDHLIHEIGDRVKLYGFDGYSLHGLRYNAAIRLAEAGCSPSEIASITGHKTLTMIRKYSAAADQRRLSDSAIAKLEGPSKRAKK